MNIAVDNLFGPMDSPRDGSEVFAALTKAAKERILILDGAMGTQIQGLGFDEDAFSRRSLSRLRTATSRATTIS